jgi:hypothetical protein
MTADTGEILAACTSGVDARAISDRIAALLLRRYDYLPGAAAFTDPAPEVGSVSYSPDLQGCESR